MVTFEHAKRWVEYGHSVDWFTAKYGSAPGSETVSGIHMIRRGHSYGVYLIAIPYLIRHGREYDVIVDEIHGIPFFSPVFTKTPVVAFIHEVAGEIWDYMYPFPVNVIGKWIENWYFLIYRKCRFWTDAPSMIDEIVAHGIPGNQCTAIPCPIPGEIPDVSCPKEKQPTFLFVSRLVRMKGIENVLEAFRLISDERPDSVLWIIGGGEEKYVQILKKRADDMGIGKNVKWFGKVGDAEKYRLMSRAHLLLHASVKEGWGLVVLEAAAVGTPSVVYNVTGLRDVVKNGVTGRVLDNNSPGDMAIECLHLIADEKTYSSYRKNARKWTQNLDWRKVVVTSSDLLEITCQKNR